MAKIIALPLGFSNAFLIQGTRTIMVDTGINVNKNKYLELFRANTIDPKSISLIIITHGHVDHYSEIVKLKEITGAPVACHSNAVNLLRSGTNAPIVPRNQLGSEMLKKIGNKILMKTQPVEPDLLLDEEFDLHPYGVDGRIIHTPGHSDCSVSMILDDGHAIVGDIMIPHLYTGEPCLAYFASDETALLFSVMRLLKEAHTFYGSHGGVFTREDVYHMC